MAITVGGEEIPEAAIQHEFDRLVRFYSEHMPPSQIKDQIKIIRERAVDQAIGAKLLLQDATRLDIAVPPEVLDAKVAEISESIGGGDILRQNLDKQGLSEDEFRKTLSRGLQVDLLVERVTADVSEPTEEDILAHFEAHKNEYEKPKRARAQHILVKAEKGDDASRNEAREKLEAIRQQIENGSEFGALAGEHSDCPSGKDGGSLGWFSPGMMVPEFDQAVFSMAVESLSDIVETDFGLHLIYKNAEEDGGPADLPDVADRIRDFLRHVRRGEVLSSYVNELRAKTEIKGV